MPRFTLELSVSIHVSVDVDAETEQQAEAEWSTIGYALQEAKMAVAEEARCLDDYEFDVDAVRLLEDEDDVNDTTTS